jgi:hypothetical protein
MTVAQTERDSAILKNPVKVEKTLRPPPGNLHGSGARPTCVRHYKQQE